MKKAPFLLNEEIRLQELLDYEVLDTEAEKIYDDITSMAKELCGCSIALISLIDRERQWFKSKQGLNATETPRDISFCGHAIMNDQVMIIENAEKDDRFFDNPLFTGEPHVRFYAGAPLITPSGNRIGTLCVIDDKEKKLSQNQIHILETLAKNVIANFELRKKTKLILDLNEQYRAVQKLTKTGGWELELSTNLTNWTEEVYEIYGLSTNDKIAKDKAISFYSDKDQVKLIEKINSCISSKEKFDEVFEFIDAKERKKWVRSIGQAHCDESGNVTKLFGTFQDITEHKKKEILDETISKIREEYIKHSSDNYQFFNFLLGKILEITESEYGFIGEIIKNNEEKYLKTFAITNISWNEETRKFYDDNIENGLEFRNLNTLFGKVIKEEKIFYTNSPESHPQRGGLPKGHPKLSKFLGYPLFYNDKFIAMLGIANRENGYSDQLISYIKPLIEVISEIIHLQKIESTRTENEIERKVILEATNVALWTYYPQTNKLHWDSSMYNLYEIDETEFENNYNSWENTLIEEDREKTIQLLKDSLNGTKKFDTVFRIKNKRNQNKYIKAKAEIIRNDKGVPIKMMGVNWDYTEEIELNNKLIEAKEKAEQFSRAKSEFLANMSHEIRTPLNGVVSVLNLLKETDSIEEQHDLIKIGLNSSENLLEIINDVLDLSKIESGKIDLEKKSISLNKFSSDIINSFKHKAIEKGILLILSNHLKEEKIHFSGDATRTKQVVANLISNAIKFTSSGSVTLNIKLDDTKKNLIFQVIDSGIGISESNLKKLFNDFTQADNSTTRKYGGTGLGLSISKKLSRLMNGSLEVISTINKGSTFSFTLPYSPIGDNLKVEEQNQVINSSIDKSRPILVVEDNETNIKLINLMLKKMDFNVVNAKNGLEALEIIKKAEHNYSLILMDVQMPYMDGITCTKEIFKFNPKFKIPIIALTANVFVEDRERCLKAGMTGFLTKPLKKEELLNILNIHLATR